MYSWNDTVLRGRRRALSLSAIAVLAGSTMTVGAAGTAQASARPAAFEPAAATPTAYVANMASASISEINTASGTVTGTVSTAQKHGVDRSPGDIYTAPGGKTVWIIDGNGDITVADAKTHRPINVIHVCSGTGAIAQFLFTPDGAHAYALCVGSTVGTASVHDIDTTTRRSTMVAAVTALPLNIAVSPDSTKLYVTVNKSLLVLDTATDTVSATIPLPGVVTRTGDAIAVSKDGTRLYAGLFDGVAVIDTATATVATTIPVTDGARDLALTADGSELLSTSWRSKNVTVTSTATNTVTARIGLGVDADVSPHLAVSPTDSSIAYLEVLKPNTTNQYRIDAIDLKTGKVTEVVALKSASNFISFSPDGKTVFVSATLTDELLMINAESASVTRQLTVLPHVGDVAFDDQSREAYVSVGDGEGVQETEVMVLDASTYKEVAAVTGANQTPSRLVATPNGQTVYGAGSEVMALDTATGTTKEILVDGLPGALAMSPDGSTLYVSDILSDKIFVIGTATGKVTKTFAVPFDSTSEVAGEERALAVSPDGTKLYVTTASGVDVVGTKSDAVSSKIAVGGGPQAIAVSPDGGLVYLSLSSSDSVAMINTATAAVSHVAVGGRPMELAFTPDGSQAYVVNSASESVSVIDTATSKVTGTITVGANPESVAFTPDGSEAYVVNSQGTPGVSVISTASGTVTGSVSVGDYPQGLAITP